nr:syntaxin-132-like [Tanacetum cinerariifolium]
MNDLLSESFENPRGEDYGGGDLEMGSQRNTNSGENRLRILVVKIMAVEILKWDHNVTQILESWGWMNFSRRFKPSRNNMRN